MREHPILFSAPMIRALLENRKTVTRRLSKQWLKVKAGDRLWVRETLRQPDGGPWEYAADGAAVMVDASNETAMLVWAHHKDQDYCPSIHMPRWASRITLEATGDARLERLQDITEEDARREGCEPWEFNDEQCLTSGERGAECPYRGGFACLWDDLHDKTGERWFDNPELVRLAFQIVPQKEGEGLCS